MSSRLIQQRLRRLANRKKAALLQRFFKTGPGEYGEGDRFLGIMVPDIRRVVKEFGDAPLSEIAKLLRSPWHEERLCALLILVQAYERGDEARKKKVYSLYLRNMRRINNWDLVDLTAPRIVGPHLHAGPRSLLYRMARSRSLWERRVAILATFSYIKKGDLADSFALAEMLLTDDEDLMHKAVGWMLREAGKKDVAALERFLRKNYRRVPRTTLRYAIERFPEAKRKRYLKGAFGR